MGFPKQEYWSGLPFPSLWDLPDLGIETGSPALRAFALTSESPGKPSKKDAAGQTWSMGYSLLSLILKNDKLHKIIFILLHTNSMP